MPQKLVGKQRREQLIHWLEASQVPLTGTELAGRANVSRQVIVQDISLLKAQDHPIIATSNGYLYMKQEQPSSLCRRIIACKHEPQATREELYTIVDYGAAVEDVIIEHPIYGDLKASLMIHHRADVDQFVTKVEEAQAAYLLELTDGIHNHTITAQDESQLDQVCQALKAKGYLVE
ncbi:transcription repressor NadR [Gracilibacillus alcaliphilus]|uniref:transcription repressor NadR n=1 Tax=Gracilibacillus alcaliphilus TaxID=1401441 RepID=UPI00195C6625|nr:transcription repressor NadR [Gracilibacillus alcaliphilus]MBM7678572.1 transcriptional regulator of NAD metabolism [Gracilibacillus alcaliphilus]